MADNRPSDGCRDGESNRLPAQEPVRGPEDTEYGRLGRMHQAPASTNHENQEERIVPRPQAGNCPGTWPLNLIFG